MKRLWKKQLSAIALALVMIISLVPAASAARADLTTSVEAGGEVALSRTDFRNLYNADRSVTSSFSYMTFTDFDALKDYGHFKALNKSGRAVTLDEDNLDNLWFYDSSSAIQYDDDCQLSGLTFVADNDANEGTLTLEFSLVGEKKHDVVRGTLEIEIDGRASASDTISYTVKAGDTVDLDADDFYDLFKNNYSSSTRSLRYVIFDYPSSSAFANGALYYNYGRSSEVSFTRSSLNRATFYYGSNSAYGDYDLDALTFAADRSFSGSISLSFRAYYDDTRYVDGVVEFTTSGKSDSAKGDIQLEVDPDDDVDFDEDDFNDYFQKTYKNYTLKYVVFTGSDNLSSSTGYVYYNYGRASQERFSANSLKNATFYYDANDIPANDDTAYPLSRLSFVSASSFDKTVTLEFRAYYSSSRYVDGTVTITSSKSSTSSKGDINYKGAADKETAFDEEDFNDYFQETYKNYTLRYVVFTDSENLSSSNGYMYYNYGRSSQERFSASGLEDATFYYDTDYMPDNDDTAYPLSRLSFVAASGFSKAVTLEFRAYYSSSRYVDGTVVISPESTTPTVTSAVCDILYQTTSSAKLQLKANDFSRFLRSKYPTSTLQYVKLLGVPGTGSLYYNYYNASQYGTTTRLQLTSANCTSQTFYLSPTSTAQYALSELTYVPSGSNYCAAIPFAVYGSGGAAATGIALISVTATATVPEVYGVITKGTSVSFPAPSIAAAVSKSIGTFYGIQLLSLPSSAKGTVYVGTGTTRTADTGTVYGYSGGTWTINQLRFVPAAGYVGSVEIPYAVCDSTGKALGVGKFCLGVVNSQKKFSDVTASTWCYKYVAELSDTKVIDGYTDGSFKPDAKISYGAALKLIMLAAGYPEQKATNSNPFSGYLAKARADGIITRSNVDLTKPITRLQVAQLAAGAMKLDTSKVSGVKPFTDTDSESVQALYEAGIVEGYFSNGTSTYKPDNTLTRGQVSAIVWRMGQYKK